MKVIDDVLPVDLADNLDNMCTWDFRWHYLDNTTGKGYDKDMDERFPSMVSTVYDVSLNNIIKDDFYRLESTIWILGGIAGLKHVNLTRVRLGMYLPIDHGYPHHTPHRDQQYPHTVLLYYVCGHDGDTFFFNKRKEVEERVTAKKNRLVIFDGSTLHASSNPSKGHRISLNLNYKKNVMLAP